MFAKRFADPRHQAQIGGKLLFQRLLDGARQNRGRAFGADGHGDRVAVDNGRGDKLAVFEIVHDIDQRAVQMGQLGHAGVFCVIFIGGVKQRGAERVTGLHRAGDQGQLAAIGPVVNVGRGLGGDHGNLGFGLEQQPQLGQGRVPAARRNILAELQRDASQSLDEIAQNTGSSKTPVWNRIKKMRARGVIKHDTVVLDPEKLGLEACFFVLVRTSEHEADWQQKFLAALMERPEVLEAHRLAGDIDYILKVRVANARAYDIFYQALISEVRIFNVTALLSMEEIKSTTALPL